MSEMERDNEDCQLREKKRRERQAGKYAAALVSGARRISTARGDVQEGGGRNVHLFCFCRGRRDILKCHCRRQDRTKCIFPPAN